jgi:hypothetical protein
VNTKVNAPQVASESLETLFELFKPKLSLNRARLRCFIILVLGVIEQRTVCLVWLAQNSVSTTKSLSVYRRFQRFFAFCVLPPKAVGALILSLVPRPKDGWILAMDRTNWKFGKTDINILVITVILNGVGLPICWQCLPKSTKRGNSHKAHRIRLMENVLTLLGSDEIRVLTMDREFIGRQWLSWLQLMGVRYVVRVKKNTLVGAFTAEHLSGYGRWKTQAGKLHEVFGQQVYFAAKRIAKGRDPFLAVISYGYSGKEALELYRERWGIETFFSHLKKRGYQFEDTHMSKKARIEKLLGVLAVSFVLCYRWGQEQEKRLGLKLKKHGHRAKSVFRQGFESLHRMLKSPIRYAREIAVFFDLVLRLSLREKNVV